MEAVIFCGIQATGKTTFYKDKLFKTHLRLSLDQLKTRSRENKFLATCIAAKQPFVIDNTNPTKADRAKYISLAKANNFKIVCYYFQSRIEDALQRNSHRAGKENIPEIAVKGSFNKLEIPAYAEGFDELYYVGIEGNNFIIKDWNNEI
jgi:predicted kinase